MKKFIINVVILIGILLVGIVGRSIILDRASPVSLKSDPVTWAVNQSLQNPSSGSYRPIEGKDYTITKVKYFENNQWAVVNTVPIGTFSDSEIIVLEENAGSYKVALGPGNSFQNSDLSNLPSSVAKYIDPNYQENSQ